MADDPTRSSVVKNGSINDRPLFMPNGSSAADSVEISKFRRALPQFLAVSVKNILLFGHGMAIAFPTIVIPAIQGASDEPTDIIVLNKVEISWFGSINLICVPLGCLFSGFLAQSLGKRKAMQCVTLPFLASWLVFHFATKKEHLYTALCLSGLAGGLMEAPILTYVAEITEPTYRGILSALGGTCAVAGGFIQFALGSLMEWRTVAAVNTIFPVITVIALFFVPESPVWLIMEHRFAEAVKSLQWLRGWVPRHKVEVEFNQLHNELITKTAIEEAKQNLDDKPSKCASRLKLFHKRSFLLPFLLVTIAFFTGHFSGKTPLQTYAVLIFNTLKAPINKYHATILLGIMELIATIISVCTIHFIGKRPLVFISTLGVAICFCGTATFAYYLQETPGYAANNGSSLVTKESMISQDNITNIYASDKQISFLGPDGETMNVSNEEKFNASSSMESNAYMKLIDSKENLSNEMPKHDETKNYLSWLPLILLLGVAFFSHLGIRMIPWILIGEVFPAAVRSFAAGLSGSVGYVFGFVANKLFLQMLATLTLPGTFWFFSAVAFVGVIILYFILPETEGRTLGEIEDHFSKKSDTNLLRKSGKNKPKKLHPQLDNMQNLHIPQIVPNADATIIQLQQSDLVPSRRRVGETNLAYEDSNTTHL